jgi:cation diffusion facilitator CzcD-associated flavoprotein CzcO
MSFHTGLARQIEIAIIGAGPYGLSIAAHVRARGMPFRIFGRPMHNWLAHMPKGMRLKSDGFASNLYDPAGEFTLRRFCSDSAIPYDDVSLPVRLDTFTAYGLAFQRRIVPELEDRIVVGLERASDGFLLRLEDGEIVSARRVVVAVGISYFAHVPQTLRHLPPELLSHSFDHHDLEPFRGRDVTVIGAGASAADVAGLLADAGATVRLVARRTQLNFHTFEGQRPLWQRLRRPPSGIGPGWRARFFTDAPGVFHCLPERTRRLIVRQFLGPAPGWFAKEKVVGRVPLLLGHSMQGAEIRNGKAQLHFRVPDGTERVVATDHVIAATGFRVDTNLLTFLGQEIRSQLRCVEGTPELSFSFESSVRGLYFVGIASANSFGPVMRFAFGAGFTARRIATVLARTPVRQRGARLISPAAGWR